MRLTGGKKLARQLRDLPDETRKHVSAAIERSVNEGVKVARTLVPEDTGELKGWIHGKFSEDGMSGSVEAAPSTKEAQIKARAVEFGRKDTHKGARPYMRPTQSYLAKKNRNRVKRAVRKAAKETFNG